MLSTGYTRNDRSSLEVRAMRGVPSRSSGEAHLELPSLSHLLDVDHRDRSCVPDRPLTH